MEKAAPGENPIGKKCTIFSGHPLLDFLKTHTCQLGVFLLWVAISLLLTTQMRGSKIDFVLEL